MAWGDWTGLEPCSLSQQKTTLRRSHEGPPGTSGPVPRTPARVQGKRQVSGVHRHTSFVHNSHGTDAVERQAACLQILSFIVQGKGDSCFADAKASMGHTFTAE